jgi:AraC family transcriptional activator of pobA
MRLQSCFLELGNTGIFGTFSDTNETLKKITQFEGLYGERGVQHHREYLFSELLETRSRAFDWKIKPHVHPELYQVFFVQEGAFIFYSSTGKTSLQGPCLVFIPPGALHGFTYEAGTTGRILTLSAALMEGLFQDTSISVKLLSSLFVLSDFGLPYSPERILVLIEAVNEELFAHLPGKPVMLRACLQQLMVAIYRVSAASSAVGTQSASTAYAHYRQFQELIRKGNAKVTVKELAAILGISTVHLNRICNEIAGKPASRLLEESLLEEAKMYLNYTTYSVSEIAYLLGFEYPNYFARFFRKHTGKSPKSFSNEREKGELGEV